MWPGVGYSLATAGVEGGGLALVLAELAHEAVLQQGAQLVKLGAQAVAGRFAVDNGFARLSFEGVVPTCCAGVAW